MKFPQDVKTILARRYQARQAAWLNGEEKWPMQIPLGLPRENEARLNSLALREWVRAWHDWKGPGEIIWKECRWPTLGTQTLPQTLSLNGPEEVADWLHQREHWKNSKECYELFVKRWPQLASVFSRHSEDTCRLNAHESERLADMLDWLAANPNSQIYQRQIPVSGLDTKWMDQHKGLITDCLRKLHVAGDEVKDFYTLSGLKRIPSLIRLRILDPEMRRQFGGLGDLGVNAEEFFRMDLPIKNFIIVENLQTGLAFMDLPGSVLLMGMGNGINALSQLNWPSDPEYFYWGDIDTYGLSILNSLRTFLPKAKSLLMNEETFLSHKHLWTDEIKQHPSDHLPYLDESELILFRNLKENRWGVNLRLEQERIPWGYVWDVIGRAIL